MENTHFIDSGVHLYEQSKVISHFGLDNYVKLGEGVADTIYKKHLAAIAVVDIEMGFSETSGIPNQ